MVCKNGGATTYDLTIVKFLLQFKNGGWKTVIVHGKL